MKWAVDGCVKWQNEGLEEPQCVQDAVKEYKQEMDLLAGFLEECVIIDYDSKERIASADLFKAYSRWAKENNEYEMSSKKFFREIGKKLPDKGRDSQGVYYTSIRFTEYAKDMNIQPKRQYTLADFVS